MNLQACFANSLEITSVMAKNDDDKQQWFNLCPFSKAPIMSRGKQGCRTGGLMTTRPHDVMYCIIDSNWMWQYQ